MTRNVWQNFRLTLRLMSRLANIINSVRKRWVAAPVVIAAPAVLATCDDAPFTSSTTLPLPGAAEVMSRSAVGERHPSWPAGPATDGVAYVKVFS
jgi:hypothetical protein